MNDINGTPQITRYAYLEGTQRTRTPEQTLAYIEPKLATCGITRVADVTRLDRPGIPTCCAIRPTASVLQVTNGKGATKAAAQVSALMEGIELFHSEFSEHYPMRLSCETQLRTSETLVDHRSLPSFKPSVHYTEDVMLNWIGCEHLLENRNAWTPACSVFFDQNPCVHDATTNGLASGNHIIEASLHGLYEVIERDAGARLAVDGKINLHKNAQVIRPESVTPEYLRDMISRLQQDSKLVISRVKSAIDVSTFWALLVNTSGLSSLTMLNGGWGTHANPEIALSRAITEAAQSRLTYIHGAREDIVVQAGYHHKNVQNTNAFKYFSQLQAQVDWADLDNITDAPDADLESAWHDLLNKLKAAGYHDIYRVDLTRPDLQIPVVKIIVPGMTFNQKLY